MAGYTPPDGDQADATLSGAYTPPDGYHSVTLGQLGGIAVSGIGAPAVGDAVLELQATSTQILAHRHSVNLSACSGGYTPPDSGSVDAVLRTLGDSLSVGWHAAVGRDPLGLILPVGIPGEVVSAPVVLRAQEYLRPTGIDTWVVSVPVVSDTSLRPSGIWPPHLGAPEVRNSRLVIAPHGILAGAVGWPDSRLNARQIFVAAIPPADRYGSSAVDYRTRIVAPGGVGQYWPALANVEHWIRTVSVFGVDLAILGAPWASFLSRGINPVPVDPPPLHLHQIGGTRALLAQGFDATGWGERIIPEAQETKAGDIRPPASGEPWISNRTRVLSPPSISHADPSLRWGGARAWNSRQIIYQFEDWETGLVPPPWPIWTRIENRNRVIGAIGGAYTRYGHGEVANRAVPLYPVGFGPETSPSWERHGSVTHRIRSVAPDPLSPADLGRWGVVRNGAVVLIPTGLAGSGYGAHAVVNTRRYRRVGGIFDSAVGTPGVSYRIRGLEFEARYGIHPPVLPLPQVQLYSRYVSPPGLAAPAGNDNPILETRFNRVTTRWTHRDALGHPALRNLTPEVRTFGRSADEWGDSEIKLQRRYIPPDGVAATLFGRSVIADSRQRIDVRGGEFLRMGENNHAVRIGEDPIVTQYIDLRILNGAGGLQFEEPIGYGIWPPEYQVPHPDTGLGRIYHSSEHPNADYLRLGKPSITANTIRVEPGYWDHAMGDHDVSLRHRMIGVKGIDQLVQDGGSDGMHSWGKPVLSPTTIWVTDDVTDQARRNHGAAHQYTPARAGVEFGFTHVGTRGGVISPGGIPDWSTLGWGPGDPSADNLIRRITVAGIAGGRVGYHSLPHSRWIEPEGVEPAATGNAEASHHGPYGLLLYPVGIRGYIGDHAVDLLHRSIRPSGWQSEKFGVSANGIDGETLSLENMPNRFTVWRGDRHQQDGFNAAEFGDTWVSLGVRGVSAHGFDAFSCEYTPEYFDQRMRLRRNATPGKQWLVLIPIGEDCATVGAPVARPTTQYIRPDGNMDNFRKGAPT